jgi:hypothetical protein
MSGHVAHIPDIDHLRSIFVDGTDYTMNWLFCSTSGVHGSYDTLDDLVWEADDEDEVYTYLTVLVVQPRIVRIHYGSIPVLPEDVPWLREVVKHTLEGVRESQEGNL